MQFQSDYAICHVPVAPIRAEASHRAEQVSQLLFGERAHILSRTGKGWVYIACEFDGYTGWITESQLAYISKKEYRKNLHFINYAKNDVLIQSNGLTQLPIGASLFFLKKKDIHFSDYQFQFKGKKKNLKYILPNAVSCEAIAKQFVGSPYVWGGRTPLGIDCSGFSQMVFKLMNISIKRDAYQQAEQGEIVDFLQGAQCGDLAFFDNEEGKINHVGILLTSDTIIHATDSAGCVVIDKIDSIGIISSKLRTRTHKLRIIKRYF